MNITDLKLPPVTECLLELQAQVLHITLNRPAKRNAMNLTMVHELIAILEAVHPHRQVRAIVLRGSEGNFCAGGDISGMNATSYRAEQSQGKDASWHFNRSFGTLISKMNRAPQVVIALLEGAVLGGGFGLACASDLAIAQRSAKFAMPETGLGIIPAQISPFVVARIGITQARRLVLFGDRIDGTQAQALGLVHVVVDDADALQQELDTALAKLLRCAPNATAVTKQLILDAVQVDDLDALLDRASDDFAAAVVSPEGREGTQAFIDKRAPSWATNQ